MSPLQFEKHLKKYSVESKEDLEKKLYEEFNLQSRLGDTMTVKVRKGRF